MITRLSGAIVEVTEQSLTLDVQGVGYGVHVPNAQKFSNGQSIILFVATHWNQENGPSLFGFATAFERTLFTLIVSCSGIGPKIALSILSQMTPTHFLNVIQSADESALSAINGIGPKKAEQLMVHLKHKVAKLVDQGGVVIDDSEPTSVRHNVAQVLKSLHYSKQEITAAMHYINEKHPSHTVPFDQLMRHALGFLAKQS